MKMTYIWAMFFAVLTVACGGEVAPEDELPEPKVYTFGTPQSFSVTPIDNGAVVGFLYNPAATGGYKIYFGDTTDLAGFPGSIESPVTTTANSISFTGLTNGTTYYFAASALETDGTESVKTVTTSVVPVEPAPGQVQKTVTAEIQICFNKFNEIQFKDGKMILTNHTSGADFPGQDNNCDIEGIQIRTIDSSGETIEERLIPSDPWIPTTLGEELDMLIPGYVEGSSMVIQSFAPIQDKCSIFSSTNLYYISAAPDETGVFNKLQFNAIDCAESNDINFEGTDAISFQLTYTVEE